MRNKANILIIIFNIVIMSGLAHAVIIEGTSSNQINYQNGDLIQIEIQTNAAGLDVTADFSQIDSRYDARSVLIEPEGTTYFIAYPITFTNNKGDGDYNVIITAYDPLTSTTSTVTYGLRLENTGQRQEDVRELTINIEDEPFASIQSGLVQICRSDSCQVFTESEYEATRQIIIKDGTVTLSDLTYNQLKDEISASANAKIETQLKIYLVQLAEVKQQMDQTLYDLQVIVTDHQNFTLMAMNATQKSVDQARTNNIVAVVLVFAMIASFSYMIYLRTETTWFTR